MIVCTTLSIAPPVKSAKKSLSHFQFFIISNSSTVQIKKYKIKRRKKKQVNKYDDDTTVALTVSFDHALCEKTALLCRKFKRRQHQLHRNKFNSASETVANFGRHTI